jgi:tRNA-dihydrouridine synthase
MSAPRALPDTIVPGSLPTALAPMQDITDLPFMQLLGRYGPPDYFITEYFRVHGHSTLEKHIVASIVEHGTGRPVYAQMIGEDVHHLKRTAIALQQLPIAGIDINMGCPAPKIYRKNVGGGLLRNPADSERILAGLREVYDGHLSVKTRIGFEDDRHYDALLEQIERYQINSLSIHGRTVRQLYRGDVDYPRIAHAVRKVNCPVFANGNITSVGKARSVHKETGAYGVMIGRSAIRNPWIFSQVRVQTQPDSSNSSTAAFSPTLSDVRVYIDDLWELNARPFLNESSRLNRMKKFVNFVGQGVDPDGAFLHAMRRTRCPEDFFAVCDTYLMDDDRGELPFATEPYMGVLARPNHEAN